MSVARLILIAVLVTTGCGTYRDFPRSHVACPTIDGDAFDMGVVVDPSSAMNGSEVRGSAEYLDAAGKTEAPRVPATTAVTGFLGARYSGDHLTAHLDLSPTRVTGADAELGNLRFGLGVRSLASELGGLFRWGWAARFAIGIDLARPRASDADALADLRPFEQTRFRTGQYVDAALESRIELIGCHAPFVHVALGLTERKDTDLDTIGVPVAVTFGGHPNHDDGITWLPRIAIYGGYAGVWGPGRGRPETFPVDRQYSQQVQIGLELEPHHPTFASLWQDLPFSTRFEFTRLIGASAGFTTAVTISLPLKIGARGDD